MNIIGAWKTEKKCRSISHPEFEITGDRENGELYILLEKLMRIGLVTLEDWEIVRKKKKVVIPVECMVGDTKEKTFVLYCKGNPAEIRISVPMTMTLEWEE
uniref:Uncharacterized protein n=1 Tax=viral metagenome TaxID=1070528 RepID=A0A6H1Z9C2_9ZZZZ